MLKSIPLLIIPIVIYDFVLFSGGAQLNGALFEIAMMSGTVWAFTLADAILTLALVLLFIEILKATRTGGASLIDHGLSMGVFILCLVQFLLWPAAATSTFFLIMLMALIDVIGGFSVTITAARRDVGFDHTPHQF